jgi:hypothetical protein
LYTTEYIAQYDQNGQYTGDNLEYSRQYNIGMGPGFSFGRVVAFNLMLGYGFYDVTDRFNIFPTGEMGVYYMF